MIETIGKHNISDVSFADKIYWLNQLAGELPETNIITDYVRPRLYNGRNKFIKFELNDYLSQAVIKVSNSSHFSIYLFLLSAFNILLKKYTHNDELIVGIPHYNKECIENPFNRILPLRTNLKKQLTFKELLTQVKDTTINAYIHQNYNFNELSRLLKLPQSQNRCPIFDIVILLENIHSYDEIVEFNNDLTISFVVNGNSIRGTIYYSESLFQDETIKLISGHYTNVIECVINQPNIKISDIAFLKEDDQHQLLEKFNDNRKNYPINQTINKLFEKQVEHTPNNIAVVCKNTKLSYQELNKTANQLAIFLQKLGLKKGEFVGIFKDRDINFLVAILAIYKAGGAYIPIDSTYPLDRIKYMLSNSEIRFLLTDSFSLNILHELVEDCSRLKYITCLDTKPNELVKAKTAKVNIYDKFDFDKLPKENLEVINEAIDPAYMLYTSGSTGLPKGAIVRHDGAINHIYAEFDELELNEDFVFLQSAPSSTDISVWQFLAPLLIGGKTVIVDLETVAIAEKLFKVLKSQKITVVELVPALFRELLDYTSQLSTRQRLLPDLKWIMVVGEPESVQRVNQWLSIYPSIRVVNAYGPTEAADDITQFVVDKPLPENQRTVPIGKPLANLNLYILDSQMQLVPIGVPGEICVSGIGVGDGYWKNEEKTNLSFVPNPFPSSKKPLPANNRDLIYKTGDLGRWLPDGNIEFLGRIDNQVKIRGFRIELGEIEALLAQHPSVRETVVVVREDNPGDKYLAAYVVPFSEVQVLSGNGENQQPTEDSVITSELVPQLRNFLKEKLPEHMTPSAFVLLERLPLAPSGKVDRRALPTPDTSRSDLKKGFVPPRTPAEETVAAIWANVLGQEQVGVYDNFFELGGHSLRAIQIISRLREAFQIELLMSHLFEFPCVADLALIIEEILIEELEKEELKQITEDQTQELVSAVEINNQQIID
ncbi:MAG: amino acid adenylation domain-containing protein [Symploca sp. SIO2B6]|nr:amino acid adenylation domain-containing protein [Symploca sp. SIO2B6]